MDNCINSNSNNNNNNKYIYNEDNTVTFKLINNSWIRNIEANDKFRLNGFIKSSFYFKYNGEVGSDEPINVCRFIKAMNRSFMDFDMVLSVLNINSTNNSTSNNYSGYSVNLSYKQDEYNKVLEIEDRPNDSVDDCDINDTLPNKIQCNTSNFIKIGTFKLTTFKNGFSIGSIISHSIFDQAGVVYYFKCLSEIYNLDSLDKVNLKKPFFINYNDFKCKDIKINNDNEASSYGSSIGFTYPSNNGSTNLFGSNTEINLQFNINEISSVQNQSSTLTSISTSESTYVSKNDIITAILFKLFTYSSLLNNEDIYSLKYACNIRSRLGLGEESIGNIYVHCCIPLKVSSIRELSIIELAKISRSNVNQISSDQFKKDLIWYDYLYNGSNNIDVDQYFTPTIYTTILSNWNQNNYEQIKFNNLHPFTLKTISKASSGTNFISFNINNNNKVYTTSISVPSNSINNIIELSNSTKLFKII